MIKTRQFLLSLLFFSALCSNSIFSGFKVPIYFTSSVSMGYDNNLFRLSTLNLDSTLLPSIVDASAFDSGYVIPKLKIDYQPYIFKNLKTDFNFAYTRNHYFSSSEKSFNIFQSQIGIKFAPYQSIKFSHRYIPKYYLRNYIDHDMSKEQYEVCTFSIESFSVSYSHPLTKRNWIKLKLNNTNYFYNESFTEFDTRIIQFESKYYFRFLKSSNSIWYSYSDGDNISTNNGYYSTNVNRSYGEHNLGVSFKKKLRKIKSIDSFGTSFMYENRFYKAENDDDLSFSSRESALHNGRTHNEFNFSFWIDKKINQINNQFKFKYRHRNVESDYYWVSDFKEFNKFEITYKISFSSNLNILY